VLSPSLYGAYSWPYGTSMATPHVSAALAILVSQGLTPREAVARVLDTADTTIPCGDGCQGRLQLDAAVQPVANRPAATGRPEPTSAAKTNGWLRVLGVASAGIAGLLTARALSRRARGTRIVRVHRSV
jgi:subtilisin family serine protease